MSLAVIINNALYATKSARGKRPKQRKNGLNQGAQKKVHSEQKHRLLNGTVRKCLHEVKYDAPVRARVGKTRVNLFEEGTYSEAALYAKEQELAMQAHETHRRIEANIAKGVEESMAANAAKQEILTPVDFVKEDQKDIDGRKILEVTKGLAVTIVGEKRPDWKKAANKRQKALQPKRPKIKRGFR